ncbi:MAG: T9SS type A sorting domain-containing protein [Ignavibacteria bacterium]|nr:T9SS type A sorting domain-containing protein [Ignavibacteria bacterium]
MKLRFTIAVFAVLFLIVSLSKADDKIRRADRTKWVQQNENQPNYTPYRYDTEPQVFMTPPLDPGFQTDSYIIGPEIPTMNTGFYDYKTNGESNHYIQVDPLDPALLHAVDVQSDTLDAAGTTTRRTYYTVSSDGGATWTQFGQVPTVRSGFSVLKLLEGKAIVVNHAVITGTLPNTNLYEDVAPQGGAFNQFLGNTPTGIWPQLAILSNGNAIILSRPQHITGADNPDTLFYQFWDGTAMGPKSIAYISTPPYVGLTTVGSNMVFNVATNGAGRITMVINSVNEDDTLGSNQLKQITSTDNGITWSPVQVIYSPSIVGVDTFTVAGGTDLTYKQNTNEWYYSFVETKNGLFSEGRIRVIKSDGTISTMVNASEVNATSSFNIGMAFVFSLDQPALGWSSDGNVLFCTYAVVKPDTGSSGYNSRDIYYQRSTDNGLTWGTPIQITNTPTIDECYPSVSDWNKSNPYDLNIVYMKDPGVGPASYNGVSPLAPPSRNQQIYRKISEANVIGISGSQIDLKDYRLNQNYPNPFNPSTTISYNLVKNGFVSLKIYNVLGKEVKTLVNEFQQAGQKEISFNAADLSSGVYFTE